MPRKVTVPWQRLLLTLCFTFSAFAGFRNTGLATAAVAASFSAALLLLVQLPDRRRRPQRATRWIAFGLLAASAPLLWNPLPGTHPSFWWGMIQALAVVLVLLLMRSEKPASRSASVLAALFLPLLLLHGLPAILSPYMTPILAVALLASGVLQLADARLRTGHARLHALGFSTLAWIPAALANADEAGLLFLATLLLHLLAFLSTAWRSSGDFAPLPAESHLNLSASRPTVGPLIAFLALSGILAVGALAALRMSQLLAATLPAWSWPEVSSESSIRANDTQADTGADDPSFPAESPRSPPPAHSFTETPDVSAPREDLAPQARDRPRSLAPDINFDHDFARAEPGTIGMLEAPEAARPRLPLYLRIQVMDAVQRNGFAIGNHPENRTGRASNLIPAFFRPAPESSPEHGLWTLRLREGGGAWIPLPGPIDALHGLAPDKLEWVPSRFALRLTAPSPSLSISYENPHFARRVPHASGTDLTPFLMLWGDPDYDDFIRELALTIAGGDDDLSAGRFAQRALNWLRRHASYNDEVRIQAGEGPALYRWLLHHSDGYCEHFAGAFVLLARGYGIPARVVTGFLLTESPDEENRIRIRDTSAHAWAEILMGDQWERIEATPPDRRAQWRPLLFNDEGLVDGPEMTVGQEDPAERPSSTGDRRTAATEPSQPLTPQAIAEASDPEEPGDSPPKPETETQVGLEPAPDSAPEPSDPAPPENPVLSDEGSARKAGPVESEDAPPAQGVTSPEPDSPTEPLPGDLGDRSGADPAVDPDPSTAADESAARSDEYQAVGENENASPGAESPAATTQQAKPDATAGADEPTLLDATAPPEEPTPDLREPPENTAPDPPPTSARSSESDGAPLESVAGPDATDPGSDKPLPATPASDLGDSDEAQPILADEPSPADTSLPAPPQPRSLTLEAVLRTLAMLATLAILALAAVLALRQWHRHRPTPSDGLHWQERQRAGRLLAEIEDAVLASDSASGSSLEELRVAFVEMRYGEQPDFSQLPQLEQRWQNLMQQRRGRN